MTFRPPLIKQLDGSRLAGQNCNCASAAMTTVRHQRGARPAKGSPWYPTGASVRAATGDTSGGTNLGQTDYAINRVYGIDLDTRYRLAWTDFLYEINSGRGAVLQISAGPLYADPRFRGSESFRGNHSVHVNESRAGGDLLVYDPLWDGRRSGIPKGPQWVPAALLRRAAGALVVDPTTGRRLGDGLTYCQFSRDTEPDAPKPAPEPFEYGRNSVITAGGLRLASSHVMALKLGQALYREPRSGAAVVTRMSRAASVDYFGIPASGWRTVLVSTKSGFSDGIARPVLVYVPSSAGPVTSKA